MSRQHFRPFIGEVCRYLQIGKDDGATVACGGRVPEGKAYERGFFVEPTLFTDASNDMRVAREEVFGPVLVAIPFDDEDQAVEIANDSPYGLGSGVFTTNQGRAHRMIRRLESGTVYVNTYNMVYPQAPFPAWKQSGNAVERGMQGLHENTRYKNVVMDISGEAIQWP